MSRPRVAVLACPADAPDEQVTERLLHGAELVGGLDDLFRDKKKVFIKPNLGLKDIRTVDGRQVALLDRSVFAATLAVVRRYYNGELLVGESTTASPTLELCSALGYDEAARKYDARLIELNDPPFVEIEPPGGGLMFRRYTYSRRLLGVDMVVSATKMKAHLSTGASGCLKNMFGITPTNVYGRSRRELHSPVRLPYVLVDIASTFTPRLCIIDALIAQEGSEWHARPLRMDTLLIGDNVVATDATEMRLMSMNPQGDYPDFPFLFDANPLRIAAAQGLGPLEAGRIDVVGDDLYRRRKRFEVDRYDTTRVEAVRCAIAAEAQAYLRLQDGLLSTSYGKYVAIINGHVAATVDNVDDMGPRSKLAAQLGNSESPVFVKRVLRPEEDLEHMAVYDNVRPLAVGP